MIASPGDLFALCVRRMFCGGGLNARRKARRIRSRSAKAGLAGESTDRVARLSHQQPCGFQPQVSARNQPPAI